MDDKEAYEKFVDDNWVYYKNVIASLSGTEWGSTCPIPDEKTYVVRPIKNLDGCGKDSKIVNSLKGFYVPKGMFWQQFLIGTHWTADYVKMDGKWVQINSFEGIKASLTETKKFIAWNKITDSTPNAASFLNFKLPNQLADGVRTCKHINIECIGDKIIEVHLRPNSDPVQYNTWIPIWADELPRRKEQMQDLGYKKIEDTQNHPNRIGFWVK